MGLPIVQGTVPEADDFNLFQPRAHDGANVAVYLDSMRPMTALVQLDEYSGTANCVRMIVSENVLFYKRDDNDITSASNPDGSVRVDQLGRRWKRLQGDVTAEVAGIVAAAETAKTDANLAKIAAEAARDSINTTGKVFTAAEHTAGASISGTTNGQQFAVLAANLLSYGIWRNNAGVAQQLSAVYTKAFIDSLGFDTTYGGGRIGYAKAVLDAVNAMAIGIRNDGHIIFGHGGDIALRLDTHDAAIIDAAAALAAYIAGVPTQSETAYSRSGYTWVVLDEADNIALGIDTTGHVIVKGLPLAGLFSGQFTAVNAAIAANTKWIKPVGFYASGDSLTNGYANTPYPAQLATLLGVPVINAGVGGQTSTQIAGRQGGVVPLLTVTGNTIPAAGAVDVTAWTSTIHNNQGPGPVMGTLAGITGTLTATAYDGGGNPTAISFTRTAAGSALVIDPETPFLIDTSNLRDFMTSIFWYGRNNFTSPAIVKADIAAAIAFLKPQDRRFVVLSIPNGSGEPAGSANHTAITALNRELKLLYPGNYLDIRSLLVRSGTGMGQDAIDAANDIPPASLRYDNIHFNTAGLAIIANRIYQFLTQKGWTA